MNINFILQGKGGIGKSFLASVISQSLLTNNHRIMCIDTDPVNASFAGFKSLNIHQIKILDENKEIDSSAFDKFMELICSAEEIDDVIIDNGAASFIALTNYLLLNGIFDMLQEMGHSITVHTIVVGGQAFSDTLVGVNEVCNYFKDKCSIVVWENEYFGKIERNGKQFTDFPVYKNNADQITHVLKLEHLHEMFANDLKRMNEMHLTFDDANQSKDFTFMQKNRLNIIKNKLFEQCNQLI